MIDLDGLRLIGNEDTATRLETAEDAAARFGPRYDIVRRETLFVLTDDTRHLANCLAWPDAPDPTARAFAAEALARYRLPPDLAEPGAARLANGRHEEVALPLTIAWLATRGVPAGSPQAFRRQLPFIRSVLDAPPARRPAVLARSA